MRNAEALCLASFCVICLADMDEAMSSNMNKVQVFFIIVIDWFKIFHSIANISLLVGKYCSLGSFNIFFINLIRYFYRISFFPYCSTIGFHPTFSRYAIVNKILLLMA